MNGVFEMNEKRCAMHPGIHPAIEALVYPPLPADQTPAWIGLSMPVATVADALNAHSATATPATGDGMHVEFERRLAEESERRFEAGRRQGHEEGVQSERKAQAAERSIEQKERTEQIAALVRKFEEERDRYLHVVEHEVVELALAIASRILRREAQMDPLLLTGAVRVALGQLSNATRVHLRVPRADLDMWTEAIEHLPNLAVKPSVFAEEGMRLGNCVIETELGSVDLGIRSQLREIERGFFDGEGRNGSSDVDAKNLDARERL